MKVQRAPCNIHEATFMCLDLQVKSSAFGAVPAKVA